MYFYLSIKKKALKIKSAAAEWVWSVSGASVTAVAASCSAPAVLRRADLKPLRCPGAQRGPDLWPHLCAFARNTEHQQRRSHYWATSTLLSLRNNLCDFRNISKSREPPFQRAQKYLHAVVWWTNSKYDADKSCSSDQTRSPWLWRSGCWGWGGWWTPSAELVNNCSLSYCSQESLETENPSIKNQTGWDTSGSVLI